MKNQTKDNGLQFLPTREADEDQQQAIFNLMLLADGGFFRCTNCGADEMDPYLQPYLDLDILIKVGNWLSRESIQLQEGQRWHEPDNWTRRRGDPPSGYAIVAPSRSASREIQAAAAALVQAAQSAERPCRTCGETMRVDYDADEKHAVLVINEWLGRQYSIAA
jgi:hypothetical protein